MILFCYLLVLIEVGDHYSKQHLQYLVYLQHKTLQKKKIFERKKQSKFSRYMAILTKFRLFQSSRLRMVGKVRLVGIIVGIPTKNHVVGNWSESRPNELVGTLSEISDLSPTKCPSLFSDKLLVGNWSKFMKMKFSLFFRKLDIKILI